MLFAACCGNRWGMCLPTVSVIVLRSADAAPLVSTVVGVDFGVWWRVPASWPCMGPGRPSLLGGGVSLQVAEEDVGGFGRRHREVDVLCLHDCGVRRPAPGVVDVVEGDLNGVGC